MLPKYSDAEVAFKQGELDKAKKICLDILKNNSKDIDTLILLSVIAFQTNNLDKSLEILNYTIKNFPEIAEAFFNKAHVLYFKKNYSESLISVNKALELNNQYFECYNLKGLILLKQNNEILAIESFNNSIKINPNYFEGYKNLFNLYNETNKLDNALKILDKASEKIKNNYEIHFFRSLIFDKQKKLNQAINELNKCIEYKKDNSEVFNLRGLLYTNLNKSELAQADFEECIRLDPKKLSAYHNMGNLFINYKKINEAAQYYKKAVEIDKFYRNGIGNYLHAKQLICDWQNYKKEKNDLKELIENDKNVCSSFHLLSLFDSPLLQYKNSKLENKYYKQKNNINLNLKKKTKIRIAYYSADFCDHPVAHQISELIENHDRNKFEVYAFSFNSKDDDVKKRLINSFDEFIDVENKSDEEIIQMSRNLDIDIAIDLMGYTKSNRFEIFEKKCAPIQVNFFGFPCTSGSDNIDYIVADKFLIPEKSQAYYSEKIIYLPNCYMVNDTKKKISNKVFLKENFGLPKDSFIFCNFNQVYRVSPDVFDSWMNILNQVNNSVLWFFSDDSNTIKNIKKEAIKKGINENRIIIAEKMNLSDHLARQKLCDLFIDTFPFNGASTVCNALWVGLPVLTKIGESFTGRAAASILNALELNELITNTKEDYENLAINLALNKDKLKNIKEKLNKNILTKPLFNTKVYTKKLEKAFEICFENKLNNIKKNIVVN